MEQNNLKFFILYKELKFMKIYLNNSSHKCSKSISNMELFCEQKGTKYIYIYISGSVS